MQKIIFLGHKGFTVVRTQNIIIVILSGAIRREASDCGVEGSQAVHL